MLTHQHTSKYSSRPTTPNQSSLAGRGSRMPTARFLCSAALTLAVALVLTGCITSRDTSRSPINTATSLNDEAHLPAPRPIHKEILKKRDAPRPSGELTLSQATLLAIEHNPELKAFAWDSQGALARIRQARLWANPELELERENFGGTGKYSGSILAETTLSIAQNLPLGGDIRQRRTLAELESQLADWDYHAARLDTLVEVTLRFVAALAADRRLELANQELELAKATEKITVTRVEAGDTSPVELARVVVPVVTAELSLSQSQRARDTAYRRLSLIWGGRTTTFEKVIGNLDTVSPAPSLEALIQHINNNPEVARWAIEISVRIAERRLAKAEAMPNLTGRLGLKRDKESGNDALVVGLSLPLPLFDRGQARIQAARMGETSARNRQLAAELRVESMLSEASAALATAYEEAIAMRARALPAANRAYQGTQLAFKEGKLPFLDVLDAQRTLFALQQRYLDALVAYHSAAAAIESLIGQSLADLQNQTPLE